MKENQKPSYFSILTAPVRYSTVLNDFEKLLFSELTALANAKGYATASNSYLAYVFGKSERTIARSLETMKKHGYIRVETMREGKKIVARNIYVISEAEQKTLSFMNDSAKTDDTDKFDKTNTKDTDKFDNAKNGNAKNGVVNNTSSFNNTSINNIKDNGILKNADTPVKKKPVDKYKEQVHEVIKYLNEKANKSFRLDTKAHHGFIKGRLKDGYTVDDLKRVIDIKTAQWLNDDRMNEFLRPKTLFNTTNFEGYVNEQPKKAFTAATNDYDRKRQQSNTEQPKTSDSGDMIFTAMYDYAFDGTVSKRDAKIKFKDVENIFKFKGMAVEGYEAVEPVVVNDIKLSMLCSVIAEFVKNEYTASGNKPSEKYSELMSEYVEQFV